jgi:integrase/recombinase XerD
MLSSAGDVVLPHTFHIREDGKMPKVAKPRKKGQRWEINYLDADGKRRWETHRTHKAASGALRQRQAEADEIRAGSKPAPPRAHSFDELVQLWYEVKHAKRTLADDKSRVRNYLKPAFGELAVHQITPRRISALERRLTRILQPNTIRNVLGLLRAMLNLAVEHGWLASAPKVRLPRAPDLEYSWLRSDQEIRRFLEAASKDPYPGVLQLFATAVYTGMRAGELLGLRWDDVDLERRLITVQRSYNNPTKTSRIRRVPILDPLLPLLRAWKLACPSAELVFPNQRGNMHGSGSSVTRVVFQRTLASAKIEGLTFHDLRHTFASHWVLKGGDLYRLQRVLGHQSIELTQRYAHLAPDAFAQDLGRFGDYVPKVEVGGMVVELPPDKSRRTG